MKNRKTWIIGFSVLSALLAALVGREGAAAKSQQTRAQPGGVPVFQVDPTWPKQPFTSATPWRQAGPPPEKWMIGQVAGVHVDANDHIWIVHRNRTLITGYEDAASFDPPEADCCWPAPSVIELDQAGNILQAWGGPGPEYEWPKSTYSGSRARPAIQNYPVGYDWVESEHSIFVDDRDNTVWLTNNGGSHILKFTRDGKFLLQIGRKGQNKGSNDTADLGRPAGLDIDPKANEVYVADGYGNRRIVVFDATTGAYKRHWGAYGNRPDDTIPFKYDPKGPRSQQFDTVHCVHISRDDLVYVCDRANNRIQIFKKDGTFVKERVVTPQALRGGVMDIGFSRDPEQRLVYVADGRNEKVWILRRDDLEIIGSFGHPGHAAGGFTVAHGVALDSKGNIYVSETVAGLRVQRFLYKGMAPLSTSSAK